MTSSSLNIDLNPPLNIPNIPRPFNYIHNFKEKEDKSLHVVTGLTISKPKYK
jgi:hypothetical protein